MCSWDDPCLLLQGAALDAHAVRTSPEQGEDFGSDTALRAPRLGRQGTVILPTQPSACASFLGLFTAGEHSGFQGSVFYDVHAVVAKDSPSQSRARHFLGARVNTSLGGGFGLGPATAGVISYPRRLGFLSAEEEG